MVLLSMNWFGYVFKILFDLTELIVMQQKQNDPICIFLNTNISISLCTSIRPEIDVFVVESLQLLTVCPRINVWSSSQEITTRHVSWEFGQRKGFYITLHAMTFL